MFEAPRSTQLANGLRVVSQSMSGMASVGIGVWVGVGSRYEETKSAGVSHFLEHLLFKGTRRRTAKQITQEIEGIGGNLNAFTSEEHTCYTVKVHHRHAPKAMEILGDMIVNSTLPLHEVERERGVIQEEISMSRDNPGEHVQELLSGLLWPGQPLGRLIIGTPHTIRAMRRSEIMNFKTKYYVARNIVVAAAGNMAHASLVALVRRWLDKLPTGAAPGFQEARTAAAESLEACQVQRTEQVHVAMGFPGYPRGHADRFAAKVLAVILGGNMSSRLFQEVREKRGLAYDVNMSAQHYHDAGSFMVYAGVEPKRFRTCLGVIGRVFQDFKKRGVQKEELRRAKEYHVGTLTLGLEKTMDRMLWLGEWVSSLGRVPDLGTVIRQIEAVKAADLERIAGECLRLECCRLQTIGPCSATSNMLGNLNF